MNRRQFVHRAATAAFGTSMLGVARAVSVPSSAGVTSNEIRIGQSAVFSGNSASLGLEMKEGIDACFKAVNARGGIGGRSLRLVTLDDGYEPDRCAANTTKLVNDGVLALLGFVGTSTCNAALPIFTASKVPFIGAYTGASSLRTPFNPHIFNVRASYIDEGPHIVKQLAVAKNPKIAIFHQSDAYGIAVRESIEIALKAQGLTPVAVTTVERNSVDVRRAAEVLASSGATAVALGSVYGASAELVKALRARGVSMQYGSVSFIGTSGLIDRFGDDARGIAISQVMPFPFSGGTTLTREYQRAMTDAGTARFSYGSMEGYVGARVLTEGLRRAGSQPTREGLERGLESFGKLDLGGFGVNFTPDNHNGSSFVELTVVGLGKTVIR